MKSLAFAWGVGKNRPREAYSEMVLQNGTSKYKLKQQQSNHSTGNTATGWKSVIDCRESARSVYTPKRLFVYDRMNKYIEEHITVSRQERAAKEKALTTTWNKLPKYERDRWEAESRKHNEEWPTIKDRIIASLQKNGSKGFRQIEADIGGWCSHTTISKWIKNHETYSIYTERILPLLTSQQQHKQYSFSCHLRNHWGLQEEEDEK